MKERLRLASLLRVSTPGQVEEGYGLDEQQRAVQALYHRTGHQCFETLVDGGISGTIRDRPAVRRVLELLRSGAIQGIVTPAIDRIGRGAHVVHDILHMIRGAGGVVLYANLDLPEGPEGEFLEGVLINIAQLDHANIRKRTMAGRAAKAAKGRWPIAYSLYGLRLVKRSQAEVLPEFKDRDGELILEPTEAEWIRQIFERYDAGESKNGIARWLNSIPVPGLRGGRWTAHSLDNVLRRQAYRGVVEYGAAEWRMITERRDEEGRLLPHDGKRRVMVTPKPEGGQPIQCPAIVPPDLWERVQRRLDAVAEIEALRGRPNTFPLRGCIRCAYCKKEDGAGYLLRGMRGNTNPQRPSYQQYCYRCNHCWLVLHGAKLERKCFAALLRALTPERTERRVRTLLAARRVDGAALESQLADVRATIQRCDQEERAIVAKLLAVNISPHLVREQVEQVQSRREQARLRLMELERQAGQMCDEEAVVGVVLAEAAARRERLIADEGDPVRLQSHFQTHVRVTAFREGVSQIEIVGI